MSTPAKVIQRQHTIIAEAIELLQKDLDNLTDQINPETTNWRDAIKFAHVADMARYIIAQYGEE